MPVSALSFFANKLGKKSQFYRCFSEVEAKNRRSRNRRFWITLTTKTLFHEPFYKSTQHLYPKSNTLRLKDRSFSLEDGELLQMQGSSFNFISDPGTGSIPFCTSLEVCLNVHPFRTLPEIRVISFMLYFY